VFTVTETTGGQSWTGELRQRQRRARRRVGATQCLRAGAAAPEKIRFGYAITQSGPLGPGAESTSISQYKLWQKRVNDDGGIMLKKFGKKVPIEFVAYDDQGKPDELLKLTERLIQQDKVDMILSPYASHMNLASAPITNKFEYPVIYTTATTNKTYDPRPEMAVRILEHLAADRVDRTAGEDDRDLKKAGKIKGRAAVITRTSNTASK
jgi:branched-chain amino acid transport system substrate-binding protein